MITPIILCGGSGTRLWPLSRKGFPKQFARILDGGSLFAKTALRVSGSGFAAPVVVTGSDFRFIVTEQLLAEGIEPGAILIEPEGRNTAPAVLAAALHLAATDPNTLILLAPSDHAISDDDAFRATVQKGVMAALSGQIVTFGITPTRAETGYGWLEIDGVISEITSLKRFVEKPDAARAAAMLNGGGFLWNSGIFLVTARTLIAAFEAHAPGLLAPVRSAVDLAKADLGFLRLNAEAWGKAEAISVDYAVMERADNLSVVPFVGRWTDLGGWDAVALEMGANEQGNSLSGAVTDLDCRNTLL